MILTETGTIPDSVLPVDLLKDHLQIGTVYGDETLQTEFLRAMLRAAIARIEARTGLALISRGYEWELTAWARAEATILPVRPVSAITQLRTVDAQGSETVLSPDIYALRRDMQVPAITALRGCLPRIPQNGSVIIAFTAGFGSDWGAVPADLALAVLILAANHYENRHAPDTPAIPVRVIDMIEPYRRLRVSGGAGRW